ncbi:PAQR family membrane homeostasis protein TrhA [Natronincola ferrireducens]|uniref:Hemolysin III n=1 Tax=Natronincola ferrireducens TaxID=393762 RepID=A0A1G8ZZM1_9FIRM|nr:hemolysin III family protein [Natronincola ferrireducens]SDK20533.1 hemolysin III [Natronincola ferrireducens]
MPYNPVVDSKNDKRLSRYTLAEEIFNSISHGIGILLSIVALAILIAFASIKGDIWGIISFSIYGFTLFFLYTASTLYHSIFHEKTKRIFRVLDHVAIYLFIAGSYTPITLVALRGSWGWTLFTIIWSLAIVGIVLKVISIDKIKHLSTIIYILMGWLIVIAIKPMLHTVPRGLFGWLLAGGLFYTFGVIFYACKKIPFNHGIWHLFVLGGSITHYLGILFYLAI